MGPKGKKLSHREALSALEQKEGEMRKLRNELAAVTDMSEMNVAALGQLHTQQQEQQEKAAALEAQLVTAREELRLRQEETEAAAAALAQRALQEKQKEFRATQRRLKELEQRAREAEERVQELEQQQHSLRETARQQQHKLLQEQRSAGEYVSELAAELENKLQQEDDLRAELEHADKLLHSLRQDREQQQGNSSIFSGSEDGLHTADGLRSPCSRQLQGVIHQRYAQIEQLALEVEVLESRKRAATEEDVEELVERVLKKQRERLDMLNDNLARAQTTLALRAHSHGSPQTKTSRQVSCHQDISKDDCAASSRNYSSTADGATLEESRKSVQQATEQKLQAEQAAQALRMEVNRLKQQYKDIQNHLAEVMEAYEGVKLGSEAGSHLNADILAMQQQKEMLVLQLHHLQEELVNQSVAAEERLALAVAETEAKWSEKAHLEANKRVEVMSNLQAEAEREAERLRADLNELQSRHDHVQEELRAMLKENTTTNQGTMEQVLQRERAKLEARIRELCEQHDQDSRELQAADEEAKLRDEQSQRDLFRIKELELECSKLRLAGKESMNARTSREKNLADLTERNSCPEREIKHNARKLGVDIGFVLERPGDNVNLASTDGSSRSATPKTHPEYEALLERTRDTELKLALASQTAQNLERKYERAEMSRNILEQKLALRSEDPPNALLETLAASRELQEQSQVRVIQLESQLRDASILIKAQKEEIIHLSDENRMLAADKNEQERLRLEEELKQKELVSAKEEAIRYAAALNSKANTQIHASDENAKISHSNTTKAIASTRRPPLDIGYFADVEKWLDGLLKVADVHHKDTSAIEGKVKGGNLKLAKRMPLKHLMGSTNNRPRETTWPDTRAQNIVDLRQDVARQKRKAHDFRNRLEAIRWQRQNNAAKYYQPTRT